MLDFYFYSTDQLLILFSIGLFLFFSHSAYIGVIVFKNLFKRKFHLTGEILLLIYIASVTMLPITTLYNREHGIIDLTFLTNFLYIVGIITLLYFSIVLLKRNINYLVPIVAIAITMPYVSFLFYGAYLILYIIFFSVLIIRTFTMLLNELDKQGKELSAFSVKEGLDTLPAGVMFCNENGYIYLANDMMQELVVRFFGVEQKNARDFWNSLEKGNVIGGECQNIEGDILLRTSRDSWRFSKRKFTFDKENYIEIVAIDVSETVLTLSLLEVERQKLVEQNAEVAILTEKMENLRKEQEYSRIRSQVHDVMSQRLTAMQRILQSHNPSDYEEMVQLLQDMVKQIKAKESGNKTELFDELIDYFDRIGIEIECVGKLPKDDIIAFLFIAVLREACINAAKHADATKVKAIIESNEKEYRIEITNNGLPPQKGIVEGGGLSGLRNRVENLGGVLKVELIPEFAIVIYIKNNK